MERDVRGVLETAIKANRHASSVPVFHNMCGRRTIYITCGHCHAIAQAALNGTKNGRS